jgi:hypothetical protein
MDFMRGDVMQELSRRLSERAWRLSSEFPVNLEEVADLFDVSVRRGRLSTAAALLMESQHGRFIFLPEESQKQGSQGGAGSGVEFPDLGLSPRERFSIAHEIGHLVFEVVQREFGEPVGCTSDQIERLCDNFAAELLLPTPCVARFLRVRGDVGADDPVAPRVLRRLAEAARVSIKAAAHAVSRFDAARIIIGLKWRSKPEGLGVVWSTRSHRMPLGVARNLTFPPVHFLSILYSKQRKAKGSAYLALTSDCEGCFGYEFGPPYGAGETYLLSLQMESSSAIVA